MKKSKAVVLLSGGMDSLVCAAISKSEYDITFLHVQYGQRTAIKELSCFNKIADHYKISNLYICDSPALKSIGGSSLTDPNIEVTDSDLESKSIPSSYVPFRNANLLAIAVSLAETINAECIFIGAVEEDSSGYPDCRKEFFEAFEETIKFGTKPETNIKIITPIINLNKSEIIKKGIELNAPLELSWSCYKNNDKACGKCDSCALRLRAFKNAGLEDPIEYEIL